MASTYQCAMCQVEFIRAEGERWNDTRASREFAERHPCACLADAAVVCDDCYKKIGAPFFAGPDEAEELRILREAFIALWGFVSTAPGPAGARVDEAARDEAARKIRAAAELLGLAQRNQPELLQ